MLIRIQYHQKTLTFAVFFLSFIFTLSSLHAAVVSTDDILGAVPSAVDRERLLRSLDRADIRDALVRYGVDLNQAKSRIAALSDEEIRSMQNKLDTMPAGAGVGELILIILLVLLITDLLGITDVFPFIKPLKKGG